MWAPGQSGLLREKLLSLTGQDVRRCYQCGKCTASCPMASEGGFQPHKVMRNIQLGEGVWEWAFECVSCETCTVRCPQGIEISRIMDGLRKLAWEEGGARKKPAQAFARAFLNHISKYGRVWEATVGLSTNSNLGLIYDIPLALKMLKKGKVPFSPYRVKGIRDIKKALSQLMQSP